MVKSVCSCRGRTWGSVPCTHILAPNHRHSSSRDSDKDTRYPHSAHKRRKANTHTHFFLKLKKFLSFPADPLRVQKEGCYGPGFFSTIDL